MSLQLTLYLLGDCALSRRARNNIETIRTRHFEDCDLEVIDLSQDMAIAEARKVFATPMLERRSPRPARRIVGDLSDHATVVNVLHGEERTAPIEFPEEK